MLSSEMRHDSCFLSPPDVGVNTISALSISHGRCVNSSLLITLTLLLDNICLSQCHGHHQEEGHHTQWGSTLCETGITILWRAISHSHSSHLRFCLQLGLSEVSQIFRNKLFPELCQFPRVYRDIPPCKSALKLPEYRRIE